jgi:hypothetical protein
MSSHVQRFCRLALVLGVLALTGAQGCNDEEVAEAITGCRATSMRIHLRATQAEGSFSYYYEGTVDLAFDPGPPSDMVIFCVLNAGSIQGTKTIAAGTTQATVPMEGSAVADVFSIQPSHLDVFDKSTMIKIGSFDFNWD